MTMLVRLVLCSALAVPAAVSAEGQRHGEQRRGDQQRAWEARQSGRILPLPEIEKRIVPLEQKRGGQYLGFDFQSPPGIYTLKFLRDGTVIWVVVDGRSGQVIGRTDQ